MRVLEETGRALLELGARVAGPSDLLTTIEQVDPIYVNFSPSDEDMLRWRRDIAEGRLRLPPGALTVQVTLADGRTQAPGSRGAWHRALASPAPSGQPNVSSGTSWM